MLVSICCSFVRKKLALEGVWVTVRGHSPVTATPIMTLALLAGPGRARMPPGDPWFYHAAGAT